MKSAFSLQNEDLCRISTDDGSFTLMRQNSGLLYRSKQGAEQESRSVFVEGTHLKSIRDTWRVFELGLGQGCNFLHTYQEAKKYGVKLSYVAVDHLPVPEKFAAHPLVAHVLEQGRSLQKEVCAHDDICSLTLHPQPFMETDIKGLFDAVFHDPFGPAANPDCWTYPCFAKEYALLSESGIWSSYGDSGHMRRALAQAGFFVARGPGVGKKRETTRASQSERAIQQYPIKYRPKPKS